MMVPEQARYCPRCGCRTWWPDGVCEWHKASQAEVLEQVGQQLEHLSSKAKLTPDMVKEIEHSREASEKNWRAIGEALARKEISGSISAELRELAAALERACVASPCVVAAMPIVRNCIDHLTAVAAVHEKTLELERRDDRA